jgi:hypothetical protein
LVRLLQFLPCWWYGEHWVAKAEWRNSEYDEDEGARRSHQGMKGCLPRGEAGGTPKIEGWGATPHTASITTLLAEPREKAIVGAGKIGPGQRCRRRVEYAACRTTLSLKIMPRGAGRPLTRRRWGGGGFVEGVAKMRVRPDRRWPACARGAASAILILSTR